MTARTAWFIGLVAATLVTGTAATTFVMAFRGEGLSRFHSVRPVKLASTIDLYSMGVADVDGDGRLDVFTNNHSAASLFLMNAGDGEFVDRRLELGLMGGGEFDDSEISEIEPTRDRPGLYLYWRGGTFVLAARDLDGPPRQIEMQLNGGVIARAEGGVTIVSHTEDDRAHLPTRLVADVGNRGSLTLTSLQWMVNGRINLDASFDLGSVFVGRSGSTPQSHQFSLFAGEDRHAIAWTDLDGDGRQDALVLVGGEAGQMTEARPYPVYRGLEAQYDGPVSVPGLVQELCPTRNVRLGDADGDGAEDVLIVCGRGAGRARDDHPNELFVRRSRNTFENRASELGLDLPGVGLAIWLDVNDDSKLELIWATDREISLLVRQGSGFAIDQSIAHPGRKVDLVPGDVDGDGDLDIFVAQPAGNSTLLMNREGRFEAVSAQTFGLPDRATCAAFVDVDNDGADDFHALPDGLFLARAAGRFEATGALSGGRGPGYCEWVDADGDGLRDLVVALPAQDDLFTRILRRSEKLFEGARYRGTYEGRIFRPLRHEVWLYKMPATSGDWLAVDLLGPSDSPTGAGARVELSVSGGRRVRFAGDADGARASAGQFRVYFGLGDATPEELIVTWPDGLAQSILNPPSGQVLQIVHPER